MCECAFVYVYKYRMNPDIFKCPCFWGCCVPVICYVRYLNVSPGVVAGAAVVVAGGC